MNKVADNSLNNVLLFALSLNYVLWGVNWEIPIFGLPFSYLFVATVIFAAMFLPQSSYDLRDFAPIFFFISIIIFYALFGLPDILTSDNVARDLNFLIESIIKLVIAIFLIFVCQSLFRSEYDLRTFVSFSSLLLLPLALFLYWKYKIVWDVSWLGVAIDNPSKGGKNSFASAVALLAPLLFINFKYNNLYKVLAAFGLIAFFILLFYVNSRSMVIVSIAQLICFLCFTRMISIKAKIVSFSLFLILAIPVMTQSEAILRWVTRQNVNEVIVNDSAIDTLAFTHRFWLLEEAADGFVDSKGFGNGTASFRIRPTNLGHRTETHNDYMLILYEQGLIGIIFFLNLLFYRFYRTVKAWKRTRDPCVLASLCMITGTMIALVFMNFYTSLLFWIIIGLNVAIVNFSLRDNLKSLNFN
tara:strand:- start:40421 stop:41662 length:1242 start_codon:yes stop_codon:yes gene_type:complete